MLANRNRAQALQQRLEALQNQAQALQNQAQALQQRSAATAAPAAAAATGSTANWTCEVCRFSNYYAMPYCEGCEALKGTKKPVLKPREDETGREIFLDGAKTFAEHRAELVADPAAYHATLVKLLDAKVALAGATQSRAAAACILHSGPELKATALSRVLPAMNVAEVLGLVRLLDAPRERRQLAAKADKLALRKKPRVRAIAALNRRIGELTDMLGDEAAWKAWREAEADAPPAPTYEATAAAAAENAEAMAAAAPAPYLSSMSGAVAKHMKRWAKRLTETELEFFMLNFSAGSLPTEPWKNVADKVHFGPEDFALPYFMHVVFGAPAPRDTLVAKMAALAPPSERTAPKGLGDLFEEYPQLAECYSYLRKRFDRMPFKVVKKLMAHAPLEDVFWFYDEMLKMIAGLPHQGRKKAIADAIVGARLAAGEKVDVRGRGRGGYGKLLQAVLGMRKRKSPPAFLPGLIGTCEKELQALKTKYGENDASIAVLGDCSGSMQVAVETATIVGSLLSSVLRAELVFFNNQLILPPVHPATVGDVLLVTETIRATRSTAPAAALAKWYTTRKKVDLFIVVTDEVENAKFQLDVGGGVAKPVDFAELMEMYLAEVNPEARTFFVSFIDAPPTQLGRMRSALQLRGVPSREFRMDRARPDLTKLGQLLSLLSLDEAIRPAADAAAEAEAEAASVATASASSSDAEAEEAKDGEAAAAAAAASTGAAAGAKEAAAADAVKAVEAAEASPPAPPAEAAVAAVAAPAPGAAADEDWTLVA